MSNIAELPTPREVEQAKESSRTLAKYARQERVTMSIKSNSGETEDVILPGHAMDLLLDILTAMSEGKGINLFPVNAVLTTQEAADLLSVSRPHLVKLLENKEIEFHKAGSHRRIFLKDLLKYSQENSRARDDALDELARLGQELGLD